jgi:hypothetical protein
MNVDAPDLLSFLREEEARAKDTTLDERRAAMLHFYNGLPYGDEEEGRSQLVTRDVAEVVDQMVVSVLRTVAAGDKVVEFEAQDDEAEQGQAPNPISHAQQATAAIHYHFMRRSRGYTVLHDALKAGCLEITGWAKAFAEPQPDKRETIIVAAGDLILTDAGLTLVDGTPVVETGEPQPDGCLRVAALFPQPPAFRAMACPNEEILFPPDARDLLTIPYIAHRTRCTLSDLTAEGFDVEDIRIGDDGGHHDGALETARDGGLDYLDSDRRGVLREVWRLEEYPLFDMDGDGIAERLCVVRVGNTILSVDPVEEHPFECWCPFPMPHRIVGQSLGDKVADIQRTNSVLLRNAMDSLYIGLAPRTFVHEGAIGPNTIDDLLTVRPNAIVRWQGNVAPQTLTNQDTSATAFQAIEFMIGQRESRTGITRHNQGLEADSLNKTATGFALQQQAGQQIEEYVARNFCEGLVAPLFAKLYRLMRTHGQPFRMRIDGQTVEIDPRQWPEEIDMAVRVGLGSGRKDQRLIYRMQLLGVQKEALAAGLPTVTPEHIYNSVRGLVEDTGLGNPNDFMADPATVDAPQQAEKPDPAAQKAHADAILAAEKLKGEQAQAAARIQLQQQETAARVEATREEAALKTELAREQAAEQANLARDRAAAELDLARQKLAMEREIALAKIEMERELAEARASSEPDGIGGFRPGGELSE